MTAGPRPRPGRGRRPIAATGAVADYLDDLSTRGSNATTVASVKSRLTYTERIIGRPLVEATEQDLARFDRLREGQVSPVTRAGQLAALRAFFRWAARTGLIEDDPAARLGQPEQASAAAGPIRDYLRYLQRAGRRPSTITNARQVLDRLARWADPLPVLQIPREGLVAWQDERAGQISQNALKPQTCHVVAFYGWALREGRITVDPTVGLARPKEPRRLPRPMSETDFRRAFDSADDQVRLVLALSRWAGLRSMEIAGLEWSQVDLDDAYPYLRIAGKGGHERLVDVAEPLAAELRRAPQRWGPVIRRRDGQAGHTTSNRLSQVVSVHLREQGIPGSLHALRHSFGTAVYQASRDIRATQEAMGHASLRTTQLYVRVSRADVRAAVLAGAALAGQILAEDDRRGGAA